MESESKESGLLAPLLALDIAKRHLSKNKTLQFQLLQAVAEKDPGHVLVSSTIPSLLFLLPTKERPRGPDLSHNLGDVPGAGLVLEVPAQQRPGTSLRLGLGLGALRRR